MQFAFLVQNRLKLENMAVKDKYVHMAFYSIDS